LWIFFLERFFDVNLSSSAEQSLFPITDIINQSTKTFPLYIFFKQFSETMSAEAPMFAPTEPGMSNAAFVAVAQRGTPATLNLDDIFGDVLFTPDGDTVFLSDLQGEDASGVMASGEGENVATVASRMGADGTAVAVPTAGGIQTTNLDQNGKPALVMGAAGGAASAAVPFKQAPQQRHHLQYATPEMMNAMKKRKAAGSKTADRKMSEQQKVERRYVLGRAIDNVFLRQNTFFTHTFPTFYNQQ
jgi:hypothetical protein